MRIVCPHCGESMEIQLGGRPRLDIPVEKVYRTVLENGSLSAAARELGCSRDYIRQRLASVGLSVRHAINGREPPMKIIEAK